MLSKRLKSARIRAGYSMRQLSDQLGGLVSYNAIKKYEDGVMIPSAPVLVSLAEVLNVSVAYFNRPVRVKIENVEFRKKTSLPRRQIGVIVENTRDVLERYIEVEELLGIDSKFDNPIEAQKINNAADVESAVQSVQSHWKLGTNPIPNVIEMLEEKEVKVLEFEASSSFDGLSTMVQQYPVVVLNRSFTVERKRFTALHELGHLMMDIADDAPKEELCNRFAASMLLPKSSLFELMGEKRKSIPSMGELISIKEEYGISIQALMRRAFDLGIIDDGVYKSFSRYISRNRTEEGMGSFAGDEQSNRFNQLVFRLASEGILKMDEAAQLANISLSRFKNEYHNLDGEELEWQDTLNWSSFSNAYGEDEPDYDLSDLKEINPDYDPR